jgi:hypothetical protein
MAELDPLFSDKDDWIHALPVYQHQSIEALIQAGKSPEDVAQLWLTTSGPSNTFPYGGDRFASVFYDRLMEEIEKFVCDDKRYEDERRRLLQNIGVGKAYFIAAMATAIAVHVGAAAALIAPSIALILQVVSRMGINAWCETRKQLRQSATNAPSPTG